MLISALVISLVVSTTGVTITEPVHGSTYNGDWLPLKVIVENENEVPDSVHYSLNGASVIQIPRLNTDWYTYMANELRTGYSESPAPHDNTILWSAPVTGEKHEFPTPVTYDGMVFYTSDSIGQATTDTLFALEAATGNVIWTYDTGYTDDAVTVIDGRLYTSADSIFCLDAYTGEKIWAFKDSTGSNFNSKGPPVIWNDRVFACARMIYCLDIQTGDQLWQANHGSANHSVMTAWNGMLIIPSIDADSSLVALNTQDGSLVWLNSDADQGYWDSSPVVHDGFVYICSVGGEALAINALTGITEWVSSLGNEVITATPVFHQYKLYFATETNPYYCLNAFNGATLWSSPYNHHGSSGAADGLLFFGECEPTQDSASVVALDMETGMETWSYRTACNPNWGFQSSPSITDGVMYYACTDGYLYAFGTGLKYTYREDYFYADTGANELIITSFDNGAAVAADTISFTVTQTGISLNPSRHFNLSASPNPFRTSASITFELCDPGMVKLEVFDMTGRLITSLTDLEMEQGQHSVTWDGCSNNGAHCSAGLYLCRIECGGTAETTGLCLLK